MLDSETRRRLKRLTHEPPQGMYEALHNTAYVKEHKVFLRECGVDGQDINLCAYCREQCRKTCGAKLPDVPEEEFGEYMDCECPIALLYFIAVGAAEMREKLFNLEDMEERKK